MKNSNSKLVLLVVKYYDFLKLSIIIVNSHIIFFDIVK